MCFSHPWGDSGDFHRDAPRVARRQHACMECSDPIVPGQRHIRSAGRFEGEMYAYRRCFSCLSLRDAVVAHEESEGCLGAEAMPPVGELWDSAVDVGVVVRVGYELDQHQTLARENAADGMPFTAPARAGQERG